ncbi:nucleoside-diphosphate-sugar epimerase [Saccharomonospora marina XMU15]|uniref:Nucleoside-diphosphate-sugar epimerase n=1 Tax=Saccharomonospora marina XMU15 TaxID=882083 RepID=H5X2H3_9PSEU|nr:NAD-dependent epimerase/dehydratase family protein [Saccharomonospora marina]EHR49838.1 nucleoside-diphosphate-sugar epimerase [Saccharomonospora marina XMU15]
MNQARTDGLRVVVTGATGNIGTSVVDALSEDSRVGSIVGIARRQPEWTRPKLLVEPLDLSTAPRDRLDAVLDGADVVIHLAWLFQPTHDPAATWRANVIGAMRVFEAVARCEVPALVYSSSVGAYSPGPKDRPVDERWPTHGWPGAAYTREKAYLERALDAFAASHRDTRVARLRPAFVFKRESAQQQRRLFAGPFVPGFVARPELIPFVPNVPGLRMQAVHSADIGEAFRLAALNPVRGAFNIAAEPVVDAALLAQLLHARTVTVPAGVVRAAVAAAWRMHAVPASPDLFDAVMRIPIMDTTRARTDLGWHPRYSAQDALGDFLAGLRERGGLDTPPLAPSVRGGRLGEVATGVGSRH